MNPAFALVLAFAIGVVAGLRSMTAPAVVAWAARLGWIHLSGSPLAYIGSTWVVAFCSLGAVGEYIADKLPNAPARTAAIGLTARIVTGAASGACLAVAGGASLGLGGLLGVIGAIVGAFGGYRARVGLVRTLNCSDFAIAIPEDLIAIGLGLLLVSRF